MTCRGWCAYAALALIVGFAVPSFSQGGETLMSILSWHPLSRPVANEAGSTNLKIAPMPPSARFEQPKGKCSRQSSSAQPVPRYEWGNFGARYHYRGGSHVGYYGDTYDWWFKKH